MTSGRATGQLNWFIFLKEEFMKYMLEYTIRTAGLAHDQNLAGAEALLTAFGKWKPEDGLTVHAFVSNLAGNGGYVLVDASDPKVIVAFASKFTFWNDVNIVPVVDVGEAVPINAAAITWARSASKS